MIALLITGSLMWPFGHVLLESRGKKSAKTDDA